MKKYILRYGILGASVSIFLGLLNWFLIANRFDYTTSQVVGYASIVVSLMCIPLGIKYFRDKLNGGLVSFNRALKIGLGITLVSASVTFLYSFLFFVFAGEKFTNWSQEGMSETTLERMAQAPEFVMTPLFQGFIMFLTVLLIGFIINLISSFALSGSKKLPSHNLF